MLNHFYNCSFSGKFQVIVCLLFDVPPPLNPVLFLHAFTETLRWILSFLSKPVPWSLPHAFVHQWLSFFVVVTVDLFERACHMKFIIIKKSIVL